MKTRVLVIGIGYMGKKHLEAYLRNSSVEVVGLVCKSETAYKKLYKDYKIEVFTDLDDAITKTKPGAASICTPTNTHYRIAKICVEQGLDVLIEKPLTATLEEAKKLREFSQKNKRLVLCAHTELFNPVIDKFIKLILKCDPHKIKKIIIKKYGRDISPKYSRKAFKFSLNVVYDRLIHLIYILNCIIPGIPQNIQTRKLEFGLEKENINSILNINDVKIQINSEYNNSTNLYKEIYIEFEKENLKYILKNKQQRVLLNNKEVILHIPNESMIENMINFFIKSSKQDTFTEYKASITNSIQTMAISKEIVNKRNLNNNHKRQKSEIPHKSVLVIRPNLRCNLNCKFCNVKFEPDFRDKKFSDIKKEVIDKSPDEISITGGEPTIWPDFFKLMKFANNNGVKWIHLQTNALMCAYRKFAEKLKYYGLTDALVSLYSHDPQISDYLTSTPGSWSKTVLGIRNLLSMGIEIRIAHVINTKNYKDLSKFILFVKNEFPEVKNIDILLNQQRGMGDYYKNLLPRLSQIKPYLFKAMKLAKENNIGLYNALTIPHCYWLNKSTNNEYTLLSKKEGYGYKLQILSLKRNKTKPRSCNKCIHNDFCLGVWKGYKDIHGLEELKPITK